VISLGMKVEWSMLTDASGAAAALFGSSARQEVDASAENRMGQSQGAQNALRLAAIDPEGRYRICGEVHGVTDCQTNLLVSVEAICRRRVDHRAPGIEAHQNG
jgi:hypothetical protein